MTLGIDITSLQGPHRMRGIGYTLINFFNNIPSEFKKTNDFVLYAYPYDNDNPLELLHLDGCNYEVRFINPRKKITKRLPGKLGLLTSVANQLIEVKDLYLGDSRIRDLSNVNFYLQTDQSQFLPKKSRRVTNGLIIYDIIPYVLEWEYMWSYSTARKHGFSRKAAWRVSVRRWLYKHKLVVNTKRANVLLSISEHTKHDFVKYIGTPTKKVQVVPLGVTMPSENSNKTPQDFKYYKHTSWGYLRYDLKLTPDTPYILYVGGADKRRKLQDLVASFNSLRAQGHNLKLILAGDSMQGPANISTEEIQYALKTSSYLDDIIFMGFVDDKTRNWLYKHAAAFVFPSRYEGFGLPVLEAMSYGTPVICYENAATREVASSCPTYAANSDELTENILMHINLSAEKLSSIRKRNIAQAKKWNWTVTSSKIIDIVKK